MNALLPIVVIAGLCASLISAPSADPIVGSYLVFSRADVTEKTNGVKQSGIVNGSAVLAFGANHEFGWSPGDVAAHGKWKKSNGRYSANLKKGLQAALSQSFANFKTKKFKLTQMKGDGVNLSGREILAYKFHDSGVVFSHKETGIFDTL